MSLKQIRSYTRFKHWRFSQQLLNTLRVGILRSGSLKNTHYSSNSLSQVKQLQKNYKYDPLTLKNSKQDLKGCNNGGSNIKLMLDGFVHFLNFFC